MLLTWVLGLLSGVILLLLGCIIYIWKEYRARSNQLTDLMIEWELEIKTQGKLISDLEKHQSTIRTVDELEILTSHLMSVSKSVLEKEIEVQKAYMKVVSRLPFNKRLKDLPLPVSRELIMYIETLQRKV